MTARMLFATRLLRSKGLRLLISSRHSEILAKIFTKKGPAKRGGTAAGDSDPVRSPLLHIYAEWRMPKDPARELE